MFRIISIRYAWHVDSKVPVIACKVICCAKCRTVAHSRDSCAGTTHPTRDGTCVRDFIHVSDLVAAHILSLQHLSNPPGIFNVGTGKGVSIRRFVQACQDVTGTNIHITEQTEPRPGDYAEVCRVPHHSPCSVNMHEIR